MSHARPSSALPAASSPFTATERMPLEEARLRQSRALDTLASLVPEAGGLMIFSRVAIYYLTGTAGNGVLWLPREGNPVLLLRRGEERARLESPLVHIVSFRSYGDLSGLCAEAGSPLTPVAAAEMSGLPWSLAIMLQQRLAGVAFVPGDAVIARARARKTGWELVKLRLAGARHHECLHDVLPGLLHPGMTEREIAHLSWQVFFSRGHGGLMRMGAPGEDCFLGHIAAGENGNYPSHFNGPLGLKGEHPAIPFMGYAGSVWRRGAPLALDIGFCLEGYHTDKTQLYWAGSAAAIPDTVRRAHDLCIEVQARAAERLRPGEIPSAIWRSALEMVDHAGLAGGFMGLGPNKVHFLGHGIGLTIDEYPVIAPRFDEPLEEGMTIALEPKMGIAGVGMVGVENTFEVTAQGGRALTGTAYDMVCV